MDGPRDSHIEWSKSDREREILYDIPYMQNIREMKQMNWLTKQKQTRQIRETSYSYSGKGKDDGKG